MYTEQNSFGIALRLKPILKKIPVLYENQLEVSFGKYDSYFHNKNRVEKN